MKQLRQILVIISLITLIIGNQHVFATPSLEISTSKQVYEYGDFLSVSFQVSELTGSQMVLHIMDSSGKTSAPINIDVDKTNNTITAPFPFYKTTFSPGTYTIDAEYAGAKSSISFSLIDSGKIAIPFEYKTVIKTWQQGSPSDKDYTGIIRELVQSGVISIPNYNDQTEIHIPKWFKNNLNLWSNDMISDNELGFAIQYLIQKEILVV